MRKFTLSIGLSDKDIKKQVVATKDAWQKISTRLCENSIDGASFSEIEGMYKGMLEHTLKVEILDTKNDIDLRKNVVKSIQDIKIDLNQECIALEETEVIGALI